MVNFQKGWLKALEALDIRKAPELLARGDTMLCFITNDLPEAIALSSQIHRGIQNFCECPVQLSRFAPILLRQQADAYLERTSAKASIVTVTRLLSPAHTFARLFRKNLFSEQLSSAITAHSG
jgi:hypothetical protein